MKQSAHIFRRIGAAALALLAVLALPTGWLYDLWTGTGTEQGQWPSEDVRRLQCQEDVETFFLSSTPATVSGGDLVACPLARLRDVEQEGNRTGGMGKMVEQQQGQAGRYLDPWRPGADNARSMERKLLLDGKECREELKLRLTENLQSKIAPATKAYGMKKAGPQTFVQEKNGLVSRIQFFGYFRGGGYEAMSGYLCPIYAIQYGTVAVDAAMVESIHRKFDDILTFLADGYARLECCVQFNSEYYEGASGNVQ